jgi:hypothetical protein
MPTKNNLPHSRMYSNMVSLSLHLFAIRQYIELFSFRIIRSLFIINLFLPVACWQVFIRTNENGKTSSNFVNRNSFSSILRRRGIKTKLTRWFRSHELVSTYSQNEKGLVTIHTICASNWRWLTKVGKSETAGASPLESFYFFLTRS